MHLAELLALRPVPASAVFLVLTRRCPLHCRHCSTMSAVRSEQQSASPLRRFVGSFTPADHPEFVLFTGGEPLLRPALVRSLAETARAAGTRSYLLTGAFCATGRRLPPAIRAALESVDHIAVSVDVYHEAEVPRRHVFRFLHAVLAADIDASIQACRTGPDDPYVTALTRQVRREFADRVPVLVTSVRPVGRARSWLTHAAPEVFPQVQFPRAAPCGMAAWPVVRFDGTIAACCNPEVTDSRPVPAHLRLGHIRTTNWPEVRRACVSSLVLRGLRTEGPVRLAHRFAGQPPFRGYCDTCRSLASRPDLLRRIEAYTAHPAVALIEQQAIMLQQRAGPAAFAARHGDPAGADLVLLGREARSCER